MRVNSHKQHSIYDTWSWHFCSIHYLRLIYFDASIKPVNLLKIIQWNEIYWGRSFDRLTFFRNSSVVFTNCVLVEKWRSFELMPRWSFLLNDILSKFSLISKRMLFEGKKCLFNELKINSKTVLLNFEFWNC